jgi:hypothetical protein
MSPIVDYAGGTAAGIAIGLAVAFAGGGLVFFVHGVVTFAPWWATAIGALCMAGGAIAGFLKTRAERRKGASASPEPLP